MITIKNCHSPAGMSFVTSNLRHTSALDCPGCRYGTLDYFDKGGRQGFHCIDCRRVYPLKLAIKLGMVKEGFAP